MKSIQEFSKWCYLRLKSRTDSEHEQALLRAFIILGPVTIYWLTLCKLDETIFSTWPAIVAAWSFSAGIIAHIIWKPEATPWRRIAGIVHDSFMTTLTMWLLGPNAALIFFVYTFVTVGNGFRYGVNYLAISGVAGTIGLASFVYGSELWNNLHVVGTGLLLTNALVVIYVGILLGRLNAAKKQIENMARQDTLTGLANRFVFTERLNHSLMLSLRHRNPMACIYFDLDGFKYVNDHNGHQVGDQLLQQVATRVNKCIRKTDLLARLGGDEFTIILEQPTEPKDTFLVGNRILDAIQGIKEIDGKPVSISASIGVAYITREGDRTMNIPAEELLKAADEAMYRAKKSGKGRIEYTDFLTLYAAHKDLLAA